MEVEKKNKVYGLLGRAIGYSFSRGYFTEKFEKLEIEDSEYVNFDIPSIEDFPTVIKKQQAQLHGIPISKKSSLF